MSDAAADGLVDSSHLRSSGPRKQKKIELIDGLLRSLDVLVLVQITVLYYLDASTTLLVLRAFSQIFFVSPYPPGSIGLLPQAPPVLVANVLCLVTHIFQAQPESDIEGARGYIHGGLLVDFVGELGPISRWRLLSLDAFVFLLQMIMLVGALEKYLPAKPTELDNAPATSQDHDAEEAGILRSPDAQRPDISENDGGIELQDMSVANMGNDAGPQNTNSHPSDLFYTGDAILTELNLVEGLKTLLRRNPNRNSAAAAAAVDTGIIDMLLNRLAEDRARRSQAQG